VLLNDTRSDAEAKNWLIRLMQDERFVIERKEIDKCFEVMNKLIPYPHESLKWLCELDKGEPVLCVLNFTVKIFKDTYAYVTFQNDVLPMNRFYLFIQTKGKDFSNCREIGDWMLTPIGKLKNTTKYVKSEVLKMIYDANLQMVKKKVNAVRT
jgi:hypothetical protein